MKENGHQTRSLDSLDNLPKISSSALAVTVLNEETSNEVQRSFEKYGRFGLPLISKNLMAVPSTEKAEAIPVDQGEEKEDQVP